MVSGEVEKIRKNATLFKEADQVFDFMVFWLRAHAQYICIYEGVNLALKPVVRKTIKRVLKYYWGNPSSGYHGTARASGLIIACIGLWAPQKVHFYDIWREKNVINDQTEIIDHNIFISNK